MDKESWCSLLTGLRVVARHLMWLRVFFFSFFWYSLYFRPRGGPYLSSCCKFWSVEGQQYWWRLTKLWTVRLVGNRVAKAALPAAVGVVGAEMGCPEIDDGRTLTGRTRDGRHTQRHGESRETDTQTVSAKADSDRKRDRERERALIWSCTLIVTNHRVAMVVQRMTHLKRRQMCDSLYKLSQKQGEIFLRRAIINRKRYCWTQLSSWQMLQVCQRVQRLST